jgi:hypothetical protein
MKEFPIDWDCIVISISYRVVTTIVELPKKVVHNQGPRREIQWQGVGENFIISSFITVLFAEYN